MHYAEKSITIRAARINVGLSAEKAANRLGISKWVLFNYETNRTPLPLSIAWKMKILYRLKSIEEINPTGIQEVNESDA